MDALPHKEISGIVKHVKPPPKKGKTFPNTLREDPHMYQPVISDENIQRLYRMKLKEKRPMTKLINQILNDFFSIYEQAKSTERRETIWTTPDQTNSPLKPSIWPSASSESSSPD
jgi:hypothetical protein